MKSLIIFSAILVVVASQHLSKFRPNAKQQQRQEELEQEQGIEINLEEAQPQQQHQQKPKNVPQLIKSLAAAQRIPTETELKQNLDAKYEFSSNIEDHINDLSQQRSEVRDGLAVKGMYSYSDGYFKRTVFYEADELGYRVTGEEVIPLEGPKIDLDGIALVDSIAHGQQIKYSVKSVIGDAEEPQEQEFEE